MLVDIPDIGAIIGAFIAFVLGLFAVVIYGKVRPLINKESQEVKFYLDRLQFYESQLIDLRIRLDSLELTREIAELEPPITKIKGAIEKELTPKEHDRVKPKERTQNMNFSSAAAYVLKLITEKSMTSRDIQITIGRTREHTSRLMKRLFEDGLVGRNMDAKPFTYYITDKGKEKIGLVKIPA